MQVERIYIRNIMQITAPCECNDRRFSKALDIHCVAADKIQDMVLHLCGTRGILTLHIGSICLPHGMRSADGALIPDHIRSCSLRALLHDDRLDPRNDLPRLVDEDRVANAYIKA